MGAGASMRSRRSALEKRASRRDSTASDETSGTVGTRGTTKSNRSKSSNGSNTSTGSGGSARRLRLKAAITAAKEEALEAKPRVADNGFGVVGIMPTFGGRCSMVLEDVNEDDWEFDRPPSKLQLTSHMPASHPCAVEEEICRKLTPLSESDADTLQF